jgi:hypothetical protein
MREPARTLNPGSARTRRAYDIRMRTRLLAALLAALALPASGCFGGGEDEGGGAARPTPTAQAGGSSVPAPETTPEAGADDVVRAWADTLRRGDVRGAAEYFAVPSTVSNGTAPLRLRSREEVERFNRALPCGAKVIATDAAPHGFVIATFRLTERPGAGECGDGTGATARTALLVRDGHITDWLRVPDGDAAGDEELTPA